MDTGEVKMVTPAGAPDATPDASARPNFEAAVAPTEPRARRVELVWPGKESGAHPRQRADGKWDLITGDGDWFLRPLVDLQHHHGTTGEHPLPSLLVTGDRIDALATLRAAVGRKVKLAYLDLPRLRVDAASETFRGVSDFPWSTWLSVVRAHLLALKPLMRRDGVVVLHSGDLEEPYARALANDGEVLGMENHVGTVVWQRHYAPRNMHGMREFTATHDLLAIYAVDKDRRFLPPVGLKVPPSGFANPDGDPRGDWLAEHKGAKSRRENSDFDTFVPPYRWRIAEGRLPAGLWRLNEYTGVIWGTPTELGDFPLTVEVQDENGDTSRAAVTLSVTASGDLSRPADVPWLFKEIETSGALRVSTTSLPAAAIGKEYSALLLAEGGRPRRAAPKRPGTGRYWEFAKDTLLKAYLLDAVRLGKNASAIPHPKTYLKGIGEYKIENQQTWWPGRVQRGNDRVVLGGYTEDATRHLKKLKELGLIRDYVTTSKPEPLLGRLIQIFTNPEDIVIEVFGDCADLSAVALKLRRRFVMLAGDADRDRELVADCALPRLRAVLEGKDNDLVDADEKSGAGGLRSDAYIPYEGGGYVVAAGLGAPVLVRRGGEDRVAIDATSYPGSDSIAAAVLTTEGFLPLGPADEWVAFDGQSRAIVVPPTRFLTPLLAARLASEADLGARRLVVYYFRASDDFDPTRLADGMSCKRVPMELGPR